MSKQVRVPIRVRRSDERRDQEEQRDKRVVVESQPAIGEPEPIAIEEEEVVPSPQRQEAAPGEAQQGPPRQAQSPKEVETLKEDLEMWRDRALRLQAEIENFRKRQRRLAEDRIEADRGRLLRSFLMIADDLERALKADSGDYGALREGVEVTHRSMKQLLKQEGVEPIAAEGEVFDPTRHEAVGTVPHQDVGIDKGTVVDVTQKGYRLDGRLLRPARVIVAR
jgi:molecular chaperone GrpE